MLNNTQYLKYFLNILFSLLLCLSFFSNRVNGVSSRKGTFYSSLLHHNIYFIPEWPKKVQKGKNCQKYTRYSVEKIKLNHPHHTNQEFYAYTTLKEIHHWLQKVGLGREGGFFWKLLFVQLSFRARNQN